MSTRGAVTLGRTSGACVVFLILGLISVNALDYHHAPKQAASNEPVTIFARPVGPPYPQRLYLHFQVVKPGHYIARDDSEFAEQWQTLPMRDDGLVGDKNAEDGEFTGTIPSRYQLHRNFIRYAVTDTDTFNASPNHQAYFVYDGVPDWHGALNPRSRDARFSQPQRFPAEALTRVPVYHLISKEDWIEEATWQPRRRRSRNDSEYHHSGTLVYDGHVYDHIRFRARGGVWRHAMGKNMWKINFRSEQPFQARDNYGRPYPTGWDKLNLGACIQQGQYGLRGEQGMFDALTYHLFNLAGTDAPFTTWIHLRIIDQEEEASADQYNGDFWGLYLAVENLDGAFLNNHGLSNGNLYKIEHQQPFLRHAGNPFVSPPTDAHQFLSALSRRRPSDEWWSSHVDADRYYGYRSVLECVHHYDISNGKNYYFFHDAGSQQWFTIPWDVDLTWANHMYGSGREPFYRAGMLAHPKRRLAYQTQLAAFRDLMFNAEVMDRLIDEFASTIDPPNESPSLCDADRALWDYHPIMNSRYVMSNQAGQGRFYFGKPEHTFEHMTEYMKQYVRSRGQWVDRTLLNDFHPPKAPQIRVSRGPTHFEFTSAPPEDTPTIEWRFADHTPARLGMEPGAYEITALAPLHTGERFKLDQSRLRQGRLYRVRARYAATRGSSASRWSTPIEVSLPTPSDKN